MGIRARSRREPSRRSPVSSGPGAAEHGLRTVLTTVRFALLQRGCWLFCARFFMLGHRFFCGPRVCISLDCTAFIWTLFHEGGTSLRNVEYDCYGTTLVCRAS